jgi:hypothetical protein
MSLCTVLHLTTQSCFSLTSLLRTAKAPGSNLGQEIRKPKYLVFCFTQPIHTDSGTNLKTGGALKIFRISDLEIQNLCE